MANCGVSFGICTVRLTKLDTDGSVLNASDNSYVTDKPISVALNPNIETGNTFSVRSGCGCSVARFKANDIFNWFEFTFTQAALEPEMMAMLLGAETIDDAGDIVGLTFPGALACDADVPMVAFEFWTQHIVGSGQDGTLPWIHWVFPSTIWQMGNNTFEEGIAQPVLNGFSRSNQLWGGGPYGDGPPDGSDVIEGSYWKTATTPPVADCAAADVAPGS